MRHAVAGEPHHSCSCLKSTPYTKHRSSRDGVLMGMPARRPDIHSLAWSPHGGAENTGPILWANQINILYSLSFYISIYTHTHLKETLKDIYIFFFFCIPTPAGQYEVFCTWSTGNASSPFALCVFLSCSRSLPHKRPQLKCTCQVKAVSALDSITMNNYQKDRRERERALNNTDNIIDRGVV